MYEIVAGWAGQHHLDTDVGTNDRVKMDVEHVLTNDQTGWRHNGSWMSSPMLHVAAGLFETLKLPGLTFANRCPATVRLFKAEQASVAGKDRAFRYLQPSDAHNWVAPPRSLGEDDKTYYSCRTTSATSPVWPRVQWMVSENVPAMYDVVVVNYPNNQHWMYLTVANLLNNMHIMLDLLPRHPFAVLPDKLEDVNSNNDGQEPVALTVPSTPDSRHCQEEQSQAHRYCTRIARDSFANARLMPCNGSQHNVLTVGGLAHAISVASGVVLFDYDDNYSQGLDAELHRAMEFHGTKYRAMERNSKGEGVGAWMPVQQRTLMQVWTTNRSPQHEAVKTEKEMRIEEDVDDVDVLTMTTHLWPAITCLRTHDPSTQSTLSVIQQAGLQYADNGQCSITLIVTAPGKQQPVALHADYFDDNGGGRHQIVFCITGCKTFQTLPHTAIPDELRPVHGNKFVEILDCKPSTHNHLPWTESRLEAGNVLYMPPDTYHRVKSVQNGTVTLMMAFDMRLQPSSPGSTHRDIGIGAPPIQKASRLAERASDGSTGSTGDIIYVTYALGLLMHGCPVDDI